VKGGFGGHDMCCATVAVGMVKQEVVWVVGRVVCLCINILKKLEHQCGNFRPCYAFFFLIFI